MCSQPILSLCIPTDGAVDWILPVIESIYNQNYDNSRFEVVITDNGKDSKLPVYISKMKYSNLRYKQTKDEGFMNLVSCLKEGRGLFCKMINHRSVMKPGSIAEIVNLVEKYKKSKPIIYCSDGNARIEGDLMECSDTDSFIYHLSYLFSWSAGIGLWSKDLPKIEDVSINFMFPNTSLLLKLREESEYVIWNKRYDVMEDDSGKGGYDVFKTFGVNLLDILSELRCQNKIRMKTFVVVKQDIYKFLRKLYINEVLLPTKHTFVICDISDSMDVYFGKYYYYKMVFEAYLRLPIVCIRNFKKRRS